VTPVQPGHQASARVGASVIAIVWAAACVGLAVIIGRALGLGASFPLKAGAVFGVVMAVALSGLRYHPYPHFGPANIVTTGRAALVAVLAACIGEPYDPRMATAAAAIGMVAAVCDGLDGYLARRTRLASDFGARFDMETDALLIMVLSVLAWSFDKAGAWVLASGLMRYVFVAAALAWPWLGGALPPSRRRQTVCVVQVVSLVVVLLPFIGPLSSVLVAAASLALLAWSFAVDVAWLWRARPVAAVPA
jgi:phosphatidylglycerophosphate synthase